VAGSHVTTGLREGGKHVVLEDDSGGFVHSLDDGLRDGNETVDLDDDVRLTVSGRTNDAAFDRGDAGIARQELNGTGEIADFAAGIKTGDKELLLGTRASQDEL